MNNILNIARKEFADLLNNWIVLFILAFYMLLVLNVILGFGDVVSSVNSPAPEKIFIGNGNLSVLMLIDLWSILVEYGLFIGVVLGVSLISSERKGDALNTLIAKPLYRDTIINGKLLAAAGFLITLFGLASALYTAAIVILYGSSVSDVLSMYLEKMPILLLLSTTYVMIFLLLSMLMSIMVKSQAFSLILGALTVYIFQVIPTPNVSVYLSNILSGGKGSLTTTIAGLSPYNIMSVNGIVLRDFFDPSKSVINVISTHEVDFFKLFIFFTVSLVLCYIAFIRRDIA
jgi:ABC-2 type transport system permease protein